MNELVHGRTRLTVGLALLLSVIGVLAWIGMPREEDPRLSPRFGLVVTAYPGADAETVERLVANPIEDELARVEQIETVRSTIRSGVVVSDLRLRDDVSNFPEAWSDVQDALDDARAELPREVLAPRLDHDINETEGVLIAVTGLPDHLALAEAAEALESRLLAESTVARTTITGDPGEQITVAWDESLQRELGLSIGAVARMLEGRNVTTPAGTLELAGRSIDIRPHGDLRTVEEIRETPIVLPDGTGIRLGDVTTVRRTPRDPAPELARHEGRAAVLVGVVPRAGIDVVDFGARVRSIVTEFGEAHPDVELVEVAFQPDKVEGRLAGLSRSLLLGIGVVAMVLVVTMGFRLGLVVALAVPLVTFAGVAIYAAGGGVLHQIAVAALVIALGLLVDNAIVVAESIQRRLDEGLDRTRAVAQSVRELAIPLAAATVTTFASFVPMLLSEGTSADFTRAIPLVVVITLGASYFYALIVTPAVAGFALRPRRRATQGWLRPLARGIGRFSSRHPWLSLALAVVVLVPEAMAARTVAFSFFPSSDREQLVVQIEMPEGTHLQRTDEVATRLEAALSREDDVVAVTAVVGRAAPHFYYNLTRAPQSPHVAQLIVTTTGPEAVTRLSEVIRARARVSVPDARVIPHRLEQGPPVRAPIEIRLYGEDLTELHDAADRVQRLLRETPGARDVRLDDGLGVAVLQIDIDDARAGRHGIDRSDVSLALLARTRGLAVGDFRGDDDPVPIVVRAPEGERSTPAMLRSADATPRRGGIPLMEVSRADLRMKPAVIRHRDRTRVITVLAEVDPSVTYADVVAAITPQLDALDLGSIRWEQGGATQQSNEANAALGAKAPFGALLLIAVLLAEFNSFRRVAIILATAPLAAMGIWPGLALAGLPFGFVALLGAIALIGIVVNGAIVLIDLADRRRAAGASVAEALQTAVELRTRPILLTTLTTVAGLLPLGFSESTLWPPMAWSMISGLLIATVLSLFVVPALYRVLIRDPRPADRGPDHTQ